MSAIDSPERVVEGFSRGYRAGRYNEVYDLHSPDSEIRRNFSRETYASRMRNAAQRTKMRIIECRIGATEIQGDVARVTLLSITKSIVGEWHMEEEFTLRREEGDWKILSIEKVRQWPTKPGGASIRGRM